MLYWEIGHIIFIILFAWLNAYLIKNGKRIYHGLNGFIFLGISICSCLFYWWPLSIALLLNIRFLYDALMNKLRGLPLNYISQSPKSIADKLEKKVWGNDFYTPRIIYFVISLSINAYYYLFIHK